MELGTNTPLADHIEAEAQPERWHPKLTIYRSLVLLSTIGLGGAKAYAVSQNLSSVATSIEWVIGVVMFSILFLLGLYESEPPRFLKWLLERDLGPSFFRIVSRTPPQYHSDELRNPRFPFITGYRLLTTASVASFGIGKAYFSYRDMSPAANAFDWSFGIIITSLLYVLGLYENNPVNLMPYLFFDNYHSVVFYNTPWLIIHMKGISLSWLAVRWFANSNVLSRPSLPSSFTSEEVARFGRELLVLGFFLIPFFALVVLFLRLLEFCLTHSPGPLVRVGRWLQAIYLKVKHFVYTRLRIDVWPWWTKAVGLSLTRMVCRIRHNYGGIRVLWCFAASFVVAGFSLACFAALISCVTEPLPEGSSPAGFYTIKVLGTLLWAYITLYFLVATIFSLGAGFLHLSVDNASGVMESLLPNRNDSLQEFMARSNFKYNVG